jgi:hypothetical protein
VGVLLNPLILAIAFDFESTERQGRFLSSFALVKNFGLDEFLVDNFD